MIIRIERAAIRNHQCLNSIRSSLIVLTTNRKLTSTFSSRPFLLEKEKGSRRYSLSSSFSSSATGDDRLVGDREGVDKTKKKKPAFEEYDIFAHSDSATSKKTSVQGYGDTCFEVNNVHVRQSIILLSTKFLLWEAKVPADITAESLSIIPLLSPPVEILLLGFGERQPSPFPRELISHFRSLGIFVEAMSSVHAISTFNVLNAEDRCVAAAILTLRPWSPASDLDLN